MKSMNIVIGIFALAVVAIMMIPESEATEASAKALSSTECHPTVPSDHSQPWALTQEGSATATWALVNVGASASVFVNAGVGGVDWDAGSWMENLGPGGIEAGPPGATVEVPIGTYAEGKSEAEVIGLWDAYDSDSSSTFCYPPAGGGGSGGVGTSPGTGIASGLASINYEGVECNDTSTSITLIGTGELKYSVSGFTSGSDTYHTWMKFDPGGASVLPSLQGFRNYGWADSNVKLTNDASDWDLLSPFSEPSDSQLLRTLLISITPESCSVLKVGHATMSAS